MHLLRRKEEGVVFAFGTGQHQELMLPRSSFKDQVNPDYDRSNRESNPRHKKPDNNIVGSRSLQVRSAQGFGYSLKH